MAYKRRYKRRRFKKKRSYLGTASKALSIALGLKKLLNVEYKQFNSQSTAAVITDVPNISELTNIPQGDTGETRDGDSIKWTRINCRYFGQFNPSATSTLVRAMLVCDHQTNQAIYTSTDLLQDATSQDNITSYLNLDNKMRFRILKDQIFQMSPSKPSFKLEWNVPLGMKCRFSGASSSINNLTTNSLSIVFISDEPTNSPTVTGMSRLRFVDN